MTESNPTTALRLRPPGTRGAISAPSIRGTLSTRSPSGMGGAMLAQLARTPVRLRTPGVGDLVGPPADASPGGFRSGTVSSPDDRSDPASAGTSVADTASEFVRRGDG